MTILARIVKARGGSLGSDGSTALIAAPGHSAHDRSISLKLTPDGRILIHCFSATDWRSVRDDLIAGGLASPGDFLADKSAMTSRTALRGSSAHAKQHGRSQSLAHARMAWEERAAPAAGAAYTYLVNRRVAFLARSTEIGSHPRLKLSADPARTGPHAPCLLARLSGSDGEFAGVQATFLFGPRASRRKLRLNYGHLRDAVIRLDQASSEMVVAEGLETAASAGRIFSLPAIAAVNASNLARYRSPPGVRRLVIAADNDEAGMSAAEACRWLNERAGVSARIVAPDKAGHDWNDVWNDVG